MAFKNLSIRIPEEAHAELEKLAQERQQKVSDVAREVLMQGLKGGSADNSVVVEYLEGFGAVLASLHTESTRARYYGEIMTSYVMDIQNLMIEGKVIDKAAKEALVARFGNASVHAAQDAWMRAINANVPAEP